MSMMQSHSPRLTPLGALFPALGRKPGDWAKVSTSLGSSTRPNPEFPKLSGMVRRWHEMRVAYALGADHLWFASAVITGLVIASWLAAAMGLELAPPPPSEYLVL
jgi:hypothetical protein